MMATSGRHIAVVDADLQHSETILPKMLARIQIRHLGIVVRNATRKA